MKYANIASVLSWAEEPETQDGLFLQPEEATAVNTALGLTEGLQGQVTTLTGERDTHAQTIADLQAHVTTLTNEKQTLTGERDALQVKVDALGKKPSGKGSITKPAATAEGDEADVPYHEDGNLAFNQLADNAVRRAKAGKRE